MELTERLASRSAAADSQLVLVQRLLRKKRYYLIIAHLDSVLNYERDNPRVWYYKGVAHSKVNQFQAALKCFDRAIKLHATDLQSYLKKGVVQFGLDQRLSAERTFSRTLELAESAKDSVLQAEALYWLGRCAQADGRPTDAKLFYRRALSFDPNSDGVQESLQAAWNDSVYVVAMAASASKNLAVAHDLLQQIFDRDAGYKDVAELLLSLRNDVRNDTAKNEIVTADVQPVLNKPIQTDVIASLQPDVPSDTALKKFRLVTKSDMRSHPSEAKMPNLSRDRPPEAGDGWRLPALVLGVLSLLFSSVYRSVRWKNGKKTRGANTATGGSPVSLPQLKKYEIQEEIGRGTMGIVYKARDLKLDRTVALKIIRFENVICDHDRQERIERFHREARATAILSHPNIVRLYDYDQIDGQFYMTME